MPNLINPTIHVFVHPIDTTKHPDVGNGFRWAVHVGDSDPSNLGQCANAGVEVSREAALFMGDRCAATAVLALALVTGISMSLNYVHLNHDPLGPDDNQVRVIRTC
jgi:hypothetical protein